MIRQIIEGIVIAAIAGFYWWILALCISEDRVHGALWGFAGVINQIDEMIR
jgi:hypothetical protein